MPRKDIIYKDNFNYIFNSLHHNVSDKQGEERELVRSFLKRIIPYLGIMILTFASIFYMQTNHPAAMKEVILKVDRFGITEAGAEEKRRLMMIRSLDIPYEKKKVLEQRTVFMGATSQMVYLALGAPKRRSDNLDSTANQQIETWIYYFPGDKRPTMLDFEGGVLVSAYKGSVIDILKADRDY